VLGDWRIQVLDDRLWLVKGWCYGFGEVLGEETGEWERNGDGGLGKGIFLEPFCVTV
jgi:hypothetical protein